MSEPVPNEGFGPPIWITLARCYDLLAVIAMALDEETTLEVIADHEAGRIWGPMPKLDMEENNDTEVHMDDSGREEGSSDTGLV